MTAPSKKAEVPAELGAWPLNCLAFYTHMVRDFGNYTRAVTTSTDPIDTARAEGDFGVNLFSDMMQAYYDLALAPWTAMASAMAQRAADIPPAPVPIRTAKSRGPKAG